MSDTVNLKRLSLGCQRKFENRTSNFLLSRDIVA